MRALILPLLLVSAVCAAAPAPVKPAARRAAGPAPAPVRLKVTEASIFKDGHVLVKQEGSAIPVGGDVVLDALPTPVYGSYYPYSATPEAKLARVVASSSSVPGRRLAQDLSELLAANPGARVKVVEVSGEQYEGELLGGPMPSEPPSETPVARGLEPLMPNRAGTLLLRTAAGQRIVPLQRVKSLTFVGSFTRYVATTEQRARLRMSLEQPAAGRVTVGAVYLQKGIRWIPSYRLDLDGHGAARVGIQATIINELVDLDNTQTRLVIGVPRIFNADEVDPIALFEKPGGLSQRFQPDAVTGFGGFGGGGFGGAGFGGSSGGGRRFCEADGEAGGESGTAETQHEDLFYLPPVRLTVKKGETVLIPLRDTALEYSDVYTVDIPFQPVEDEDRARGLNAEQRKELAAQLLEIRAKHQLRIKNGSDQPLTTGAASVFRDGRLAAHSLILFTPMGASSLCMMGDAPEIKVSHQDRELKREEIPVNDPKDVIYTRVSLSGEVTLRNESGRTVETEVTRNVPGNVDEAPEGDVLKLDRPEDAPGALRSGRTWVNRRTGSGRITWKVRLRPGEIRVLGYTWHVFRS